MNDLANSLAIVIGIPLYLFGFAFSAILTLITVIEYFANKNWKALALFLVLLLLIASSYTIFDKTIALRITAVLIILLSIRILISNHSLLRTKLRTKIICGTLIFLALLSFILATSINDHNEQILDDVIIFCFVVMAPAILARLAIRNFSKQN